MLIFPRAKDVLPFISQTWAAVFSFFFLYIYIYIYILLWTTVEPIDSLSFFFFWLLSSIDILCLFIRLKINADPCITFFLGTSSRVWMCFLTQREEETRTYTHAECTTVAHKKKFPKSPPFCFHQHITLALIMLMKSRLYKPYVNGKTQACPKLNYAHKFVHPVP